MIKVENLTIQELNKKKFKYDTSYQRDVAWSKKNSSLLIDSLMNGYFIPPILVANNEIVDGKQRMISLESFVSGEIPWTNTMTEEKKFFSELTSQEKATFYLATIGVIPLGNNMSHDEILETFLRINNGSIKLNKAELKMAAALPENRNLIKRIKSNPNIQKLTTNKKNDSRFKNEDLIIRCLSTLTISENKTKDIRNWSEKILKTELSIPISEIQENFNKTIDLMYEILESKIIPIKSFNTIFEAIFCSLYDKLVHKNAFIENKEIIRNKISTNIPHIIGEQMGGGIKFDSIDYVKKRITRVDEILEEFLQDKKRHFTYDDKLMLWNNNLHECKICNKQLNAFDQFEPDHIIPWTKGGKTNIENAQILCVQCNRKKSGK